MTKELESKQRRVAEGALLEDVPEPVKAMEGLRAVLEELKDKPFQPEQGIFPKQILDDMHSRTTLWLATNSLYGKRGVPKSLHEKLASSPDGSLIVGPNGEPIYPADNNE